MAWLPKVNQAQSQERQPVFVDGVVEGIAKIVPGGNVAIEKMQDLVDSAQKVPGESGRGSDFPREEDFSNRYPFR